MCGSDYHSIRRMRLHLEECKGDLFDQRVSSYEEKLERLIFFGVETAEGGSDRVCKIMGGISP